MNETSTLPALLEATAERAADSIALRHKVLDVWVARSWRELRDEVLALAAGLAAVGFETGDRIFIATDVQPEPLLAALAAHWLGGSAVVADSAEAHVEGVRTPGRVELEGARLLDQSGARFALVQDAVHARAWQEREGAVRFIYLDGRGTGGDAANLTYRALLAHGSAAAVASSVPALLVAGAGVRAHTASQLLAAASASASAAGLSADHDVEAAGLPLDAQLTAVLPLWLHTGARLNFAEHAASTADADRRELGPSVIVSTPDDVERLRERVLESLPPEDGLRVLSSGPLRARARASIRDALGWAQARAALVTAPLPEEAAAFCIALGLPVHTLVPAASADTASPPSAARLPPLAAAPVTALDARAREAFLRLEHISLAFNEVKAVSDISFEVARHEICALIGPNGAGKSSLLNVINGIYRPNSGKIHFDGQVQSEMTPRRAAQAGIARTFQNLAIFKGMTVLENVIVGRNLSVRSSWLEQALWLGRARASEDASRLRAEEILAFLRLQRYRHVPAAQLPYGLQKRVELGRALVADPRLLLLDEPMAGMNAEEKSAMSEIILDVNRELGTTVVLIEHDMRVVMDISDHVVVLDYGRLVGDGTPAQVRQNPDVLRAYLGRKRVA